jgi:hypothetical protein
MSRIVRTRVDAGDTTNATELNNTYSDYSQSGALDAPNTRDQAFDISHFTNTPIVLNAKESQLGSTGLHIGGKTVTINPTTDLASLLSYYVTDSGGGATYLSFGASGWSLVAGDVLRVWWDLSVLPDYPLTPWATAGSLGLYDLEDTAGGPDNTITDGMHCWVAYLEWDITSDAGLNFVPVPGQTDFATSFTVDGVNHKGGYVSQTPATSVISCWAVYSAGKAAEGQVPIAIVGNERNNSHGWYAVSGMWAYPATGSVTVYLLRVRITGVLHPLHLNGGDFENLLVYDTTVVGGGTPTLTYNGGRLSAVHMRGS